MATERSEGERAECGSRLVYDERCKSTSSGSVSPLAEEERIRSSPSGE
jgi:hypothetical protein